MCVLAIALALIVRAQKFGMDSWIINSSPSVLAAVVAAKQNQMQSSSLGMHKSLVPDHSSD
jgi:hypothetical protein